MYNKASFKDSEKNELGEGKSENAFKKPWDHALCETF